MSLARRGLGAWFALTLLLLPLGAIPSMEGLDPAPTAAAQLADNVPTVPPQGELAVDWTSDLADFGYRQIDTNSHASARSWLLGELEGLGYSVELQPFTTDECDDCMNLLASIPGTNEDDWIVVGAHHDAICYATTPTGLPGTGVDYPFCTSDGAYDNGAGVGTLLELARVARSWSETPSHTWVFAFWDYEEWQGGGSTEGGEQGSKHFVDTLPAGVSIQAYINLDMMGLNWPVRVPAIPGCGEEQFKLYLFSSPKDDWGYYTGEGLEVTDRMQAEAEHLHGHLGALLHEALAYPEASVIIVDDDGGQSDQHRFIRAGWPATWFRGMHEYIWDEGDTCEQSIKHSPFDTMASLVQYAGGRDQLETGYQTVLDAVALWLWWDTNASRGVGPESLLAGVDHGLTYAWAWMLLPLLLVAAIWAVIEVSPLPPEVAWDTLEADTEPTGVVDAELVPDG